MILAWIILAWIILAWIEKKHARDARKGRRY
jgi:hypothetical protein